MFDAMDIPASALQAQRARMDTIAQNMANMDVTRNENGEKIPFRRRLVMFASGRPGQPDMPGVHVKSIELDQSPFRKLYEQGHPDADKDGYVQYPNIDPAIEQVNMMEASRAYEANITMMETLKAMINSTLRLLG